MDENTPNWTRIPAYLRRPCRFFYDRDAFTFGGIATLTARLAAFLGVLLSIFFVQTASVTVENIDPFACLHLEQFEEGYQLRGVPYPSALRATVRDFRDAVFGEASDAAQHIICWLVQPSSDGVRQFLPLKLDERVDLTRNMLLRDVPAEPLLSPLGSAAGQLAGFAAVAEVGVRREHLDELLRPRHPGSRYNDDVQGNVSVRDADLQQLVQMIASAGLSPLKEAIAYEELRGARWFLNRLQFANSSREIGTEAVRIRIDRPGRGTTEPLSGGLQVAIEHGEGIANLGPLAPGETRWLVARTDMDAIAEDEVRVFQEPRKFLSPAAVRRAIPYLLLVAVLHLAANGYVRLRQRVT